jgi:hypothetical protein
MQDLKHIGKSKTTGKKVLVAYRTLPGDAYSCLIIPTENLTDSYHDALIQLVESPSGQSAHEFAEVLARAKFPDGSTMLPALHTQGRLLKVPTDVVIMTPNFSASVALSELNQIIAEQQGVSVSDLAIKDSVKDPSVQVVEVGTVKDISPNKTATTTSESINQDTQPLVTNLSPEDQAKRFRSDADRLSKQAADLRRQAEALVPSKKKATELS